MATWPPPQFDQPLTKSQRRHATNTAAAAGHNDEEERTMDNKEDSTDDNEGLEMQLRLEPQVCYFKNIFTLHMITCICLKIDGCHHQDRTQVATMSMEKCRRRHTHD
jgi:hypothetical protein